MSAASAAVGRRSVSLSVVTISGAWIITNPLCSLILVHPRRFLRHDRQSSRAKRERLSTSRVIGIARHKTHHPEQLTQFAVCVHSDRAGHGLRGASMDERPLGPDPTLDIIVPPPFEHQRVADALPPTFLENR